MSISSRWLDKIRNKVKNLQLAFTSKEQFMKYFETVPDASGNPNAVRNKWQNKDLDISPPKDCTWGWYDYAAFWWSYGFAPGSWYIGAALLAGGLTPGQALGCIFLGYFFGAVGVVLHSRAASVYHFGFPVESRIFWGIRGAYFPVLIRALTALVWAGVTIAQGGYNTAVLLRCIFGDSYWKLRNTIPESSQITTAELIAVLLYWVMTCWLINIPIPKFRRLFEIKSIILPPVIIGMFAYCIVKGRGHPHRDMYDVKPKAGEALSWAMLGAVNAGLGKATTLMINQPDIARYARSISAPVLSQLIMFPLASTCCSAMGIYATQSIYNAWGNLDWNPWTLNHDMLDHDFSHSFRAGIAIINIVFIFGNAITEQGANVIPFGADFMSLFPRWRNIRRAMWICYILGLCICPWYILATATGFLKFLGGYSIFLGPFLGIALTDYLVVRKGNVFVADLFRENGRYWYFHGVAWRPCATYLVSVAFVLPGFVGTFGYQLVGGTGWKNLYAFSWFYVCAISSVLYFALAFVGKYAMEERIMSFESLASTDRGELHDEDQQSNETSEIDMPVEQKVDAQEHVNHTLKREAQELPDDIDEAEPKAQKTSHSEDDKNSFQTSSEQSDDDSDGGSDGGSDTASRLHVEKSAFEKLPENIHVIIYDYLDFRSLRYLSQTSSHFYQMSSLDSHIDDASCIFYSEIEYLIKEVVVPEKPAANIWDMIEFQDFTKFRAIGEYLNDEEDIELKDYEDYFREAVRDFILQVWHYIGQENQCYWPRDNDEDKEDYDEESEEEDEDTIYLLDYGKFHKLMDKVSISDELKLT